MRFARTLRKCFSLQSSSQSARQNDTVFTGIQPTGSLHLGNYLGSIRNIVRLQQQHSRVLLCIVDHHALTTRFAHDHSEVNFINKLGEQTLTMAEVLLACGVDPTRTTLFVQSHVPEHTQLCWLLSCVGPQSWLNSMVQYKEKANHNSSLGLYSYPVLMAADILLYRAKLVPVGADQQQHLELTQRYVDRFNGLFGPVLTRPEYLPSSASRVMSLTDGRKKMSKSDRSDRSRINLTDSGQTIRQKITKAKTDSLSGISLDQEKRPEMSNLLRLFAALENTTEKELEQRFQSKKITQFKHELADVVVREVEAIQKKLDQLRRDPEKVRKVLKEGASKARQIASPVLREVKEKLGYYQPF